jgi:hypothetical protein
MIRTLTIAAASVVAAMAAPANAQPAASSASWMASAAAWSGPYVALNSEYAAFLAGLIKGQASADQYLAKGDAAGGAAWAKAWGTGELGQYAQLKARARALGVTAPPAAPAGEGSAGPMAAGVVKGLAALAPAITSEVLGAETLVNEVVALGVRTAGGDHAASAKLNDRVLDIEIAGLKSNIVQLSADFALPDDPTADANKAGVSVDRAAIAVIQAAADGFDHRRVDRGAVAATVRAHAAAVEADAAAMETHSALLIKKYGPGPGESASPMMAAFVAGMGTFPQTAAVERKIAGQLRAIAALVEQPSSTPPQWTAAVIDDLGDLLGEADQLANKRRALAAGAS